MKIRIRRENRKKPDFLRTDSNKEMFTNKWRKARGMHNKIRRNFKGHGKKPRVGYGSDNKIRYLISGLEPVLVSTINELDKVNPKEQAVIASSKLGLRKKIRLLQECNKNKITVLNVDDINKYIEEKNREFEERRQKKKILAKKKEKEKPVETTKKEKIKTQEEIKKEVLGATQKQVAKQQIEHRSKDALASKADTVRQKVIPGDRP